uniref:Zygote arrest 1 n=1 Tax=Cyanistes caeruleus TaxID=156563 RepID=A0A8C0VJW5_CYACU
MGRDSKAGARRGRGKRGPAPGVFKATCRGLPRVPCDGRGGDGELSVHRLPPLLLPLPTLLPGLRGGRRRVLRQLPEGTAQGHPLPGQPQPDAAAPQGQHQGGGRPGEPAAGRLGFLEQKYGYYHCKACNIRWESAYVWCVQGTNKVYFRQFCRTCQKSYNPYRVEDITCQSCKQTRCTCPVKMRHVDPKRPHRQDLCGRCRGKRLSCDSTFSFKYII